MWVEGWGQLPGQLVVVSGPSGSGKSSIVREALERPGLNFHLSVSATTRERRPGEVDGVDYYFMDPEQFLKDSKAGKFLETAEYNQKSYGTPAEPVYQALAAGKSVILEIEVKGARQVRYQAPTALFVFVRTATFKILEERLRNRGTESDRSILTRLRRAREELEEAHWYDVQLVNDDFDRCVDEFLDVLKTHGCGFGG